MAQITYMTLGGLIRKQRKEIGLRQKELASLIGISAQYLNDIEQGNRQPMNRTIITSLAECLHIDVDILYFYAGLLPPDIVGNGIEYEKPEVVAAYQAMRTVLTAGLSSDPERCSHRCEWLPLSAMSDWDAGLRWKCTRCGKKLT